MTVEPTLCQACQRSTRTIAGLCPNCGQAKSDGRVPGWISPAARRIKPAFVDSFGELGPFVELAIVAAAISLVVLAIVLAGAIVAIAVIVVVGLLIVLAVGVLAGPRG